VDCYDRKVVLFQRPLITERLKDYRSYDFKRKTFYPISIPYSYRLEDHQLLLDNYRKKGFPLKIITSVP